jgi:hypothetical protein
MRKSIKNLLIGAFAGILTIAIMEIGHQLHEFIVLQLEDYTYTGKRLDGEWKTTFIIGDEKFYERAKIIQKGHIIKGTIWYTPLDGKLEEFEVDGEFENLLLTAIYRPKDKSSLDRGTFTLFAHQDATILDGHFALYSVSDEQVIFGKYIWEYIGEQ